MKKITKFLILLFAINFQTLSFAEVPHFLDFKYILNQSQAGKNAQKMLKTKLDNGIKKLEEKEKKMEGGEEESATCGPRAPTPCAHGRQRGNHGKLRPHRKVTIPISHRVPTPHVRPQPPARPQPALRFGRLAM